MPEFTHHIFICTNRRTDDHPRGSCAQKGSETICEKFKQELRKHQLPKNSVRANSSGCLDQCEQGPSVVIYPEQTWYTIQSSEQVTEIIEKHILQKHPVAHLQMIENNK